MKSIKYIILFTVYLTSFSLEAQNNAFEVQVIGKGEPILLFPGFTCTGSVWDELIIELSKTKECHIFTFAGFGNVPAIEKPWLSKIKNEISLYISSRKLEKATIIGHSLGGTIGLSLAIDENAEYHEIIVVDALPSTGALMIPNFNSDTIVYDNPYNQRLLDMDEKNFEAMATQMASGMALNTDRHQQIKDWILMSDRETYVYGFTDLLKLDLREDIAKITVPVIILAATKPYGEETVRKTYEDQYKNLKNYTIKYAMESAHFIMYDQPDWLLEQINEAMQ
ncbi:alpha/beta fold hydrolase [Xanthomarina sp. GH4-25]|uniref:alpha/beta fold hydrolase n=1 Tax=Xanthomarina sp. GH4-25 TaxID=3349335 RepID=UPI000D6827BF|nr:alpha/beta hydrolase [Flavobacteriaceae bacterium LYZ1037]